MTKTLALSEPVYNSDSIAAVGVATHEAGHAIQHARHYAPLWVRSALVPTANIGSGVGYFVMMIGMFLASTSMILVGAVLFSAVLLFQIVTLPVEFNASSRAKTLIVEYGIVTVQERKGVDKFLNAAALTYVAAAVSTLLTLLYFLWRSGLIGGAADVLLKAPGGSRSAGVAVQQPQFRSPRVVRHSGMPVSLSHKSS